MHIKGMRELIVSISSSKPIQPTIQNEGIGNVASCKQNPLATSQVKNKTTSAMFPILFF
jgi:hypothetical protein